MIRMITGMAWGVVQYQRCTPKQYAAAELYDVVSAYMENHDLERSDRALTARERDLIEEQLRKISARLAKVLGYSHD